MLEEACRAGNTVPRVPAATRGLWAGHLAHNTKGRGLTGSKVPRSRECFVLGRPALSPAAGLSRPRSPGCRLAVETSPRPPAGTLGARPREKQEKPLGWFQGMTRTETRRCRRGVRYYLYSSHGIPKQTRSGSRRPGRCSGVQGDVRLSGSVPNFPGEVRPRGGPVTRDSQFVWSLPRSDLGTVRRV